LEADVSAGEWIGARLLPIDWAPGVRAGSIVPTGFDSYARIFHPARRRDGSPVRWSEIAAERGTIAHPEMQYTHVMGVHRTDRMHDPFPPVEGRLPREITAALANALEPYTRAADRCWFALWDGYGFWGGGAYAVVARDRGQVDRREAKDREARERRQLMEIPRFGCRGREYYLFRGPLEAASHMEFNGALFQSADLWWPDDRAWCVATDLDGDSTYVGGTEACIASILEDERFEALPSAVDHRFRPVSRRSTDRERLRLVAHLSDQQA
jgi:hypothetical protein